MTSLFRCTCHRTRLRNVDLEEDGKFPQIRFVPCMERGISFSEVFALHRHVAIPLGLGGVPILYFSSLLSILSRSTILLRKCFPPHFVYMTLHLSSNSSDIRRQVHKCIHLDSCSSTHGLPTGPLALSWTLQNKAHQRSANCCPPLRFCPCHCIALALLIT